MTATTDAASREDTGTACPPWCVTDHAELLVRDKPEFGTLRVCHGPETHIKGAMIRVNDMPHCDLRTSITYGLACMTAAAEHAEWTASFFEELAADPEMARAIAAAIRDTAAACPPPALTVRDGQR